MFSFAYFEDGVILHFNTVFLKCLISTTAIHLFLLLYPILLCIYIAIY